MNARSPSYTPRRTCCSFLPCLCWGLPTPFLRDTPATLRAVRPCLCVPLPLRHMHTHPRTRHHQPGLRAETGQAPRHRPPTAQVAARVPSMASARGQPPASLWPPSPSSPAAVEAAFLLQAWAWPSRLRPSLAHPVAEERLPRAGPLQVGTESGRPWLLGHVCQGEAARAQMMKQSSYSHRSAVGQGAGPPGSGDLGCQATPEQAWRGKLSPKDSCVKPATAGTWRSPGKGWDAGAQQQPLPSGAEMLPLVFLIPPLGQSWGAPTNVTLGSQCHQVDIVSQRRPSQKHPQTHFEMSKLKPREGQMCLRPQPPAEWAAGPGSHARLAPPTPVMGPLVPGSPDVHRKMRLPHAPCGPHSLGFFER